MKKITLILLIFTLIMASCVSKKKYLSLESQQKQTKANLYKTAFEKQQLEAKFAKIKKRVKNYNKKINSLNSLNTHLKEENNNKLSMIDNSVVMSNSMKVNMIETLQNVDPSLLANTKSLKDSMSLAISYNLKKNIDQSQLNSSDDVNIGIDKTVVMISLADNLLFNTASYTVKSNAYKVLEQLSNIIKSEPSMDVMIEGHTDSRSINTAVLRDNWDLSVKRATSIVRILESKFGIESNRLIAAGRGSSMPLYENSSKESRARNRRTKIVILPNLDKFFGMMNQEESFLD